MSDTRSQRERMLAGDLYIAGDPELARESRRAAELVRAHGGEIRLVDGTIGATFRVIIPDRAVELGARRGERARA